MSTRHVRSGAGAAVSLVHQGEETTGGPLTDRLDEPLADGQRAYCE
ncbi:hypothetical protein ACFWXA_28970 [Streptomyces atroolivaceus]